MNRLIEIAAMLLGGVSIFTVCFVGFVALSGKSMSEVALVGKLFPAPAEHAAEGAAGEEHANAAPEYEDGAGEQELTDSQVLDASLGVLGTWTLPSPYSTGELRSLADEVKRKLRELDGRESALRERERNAAEREQDVAERLKTLAKLRAELELVEQELAGREQALQGRELALADGEAARWSGIARVLAGLEDEEAGQRLLEYSPADAARILAALGDETRASEILNQVQGPRWKEYVDAYTAERARPPAPRRKG
jgi:hypothetical protein